jgi:hypothetical protein
MFTERERFEKMNNEGKQCYPKHTYMSRKRA